MRPRRVALPGIRGLEVWDVLVRDTNLFAASRRRDFPALLGDAIHALRTGRARRESGEPIDPSITFDEVIVGGGAWRGTLPGLRTLPGGRFVGVAGGMALLDGPGLVVDVGQSAVKVAWSRGRVLAERDHASLPVLSRSSDPAHRRALVAFVADAMRRALALGASSRRVVLALPAALDDAGTPEGSSYPGMAGDEALVPDILALAGIAGTETLLLNDAELAALSARPLVTGRALVLTVGFGVGAALLDATAAAE